MKRPGSFLATVKLWIMVISALWLGACAARSGVTPTTNAFDEPPLATAAQSETAATESDALAGIPDEARVATRRGEPRPPAYWALWNSCAPDNRAATAAANGGRAAGWFLMDDILADPGIQLGEYPVTTCAEGWALLQGDGAVQEIDTLAARLLAAELNLNIGAETCPIAEEVVVGAHIVLAGVGFTGPGTGSDKSNEEFVSAIPRLAQLLALYNSGELCR